MASNLNSKDQPFYLPLSRHPPTPAFSDLLEKYGKIPKSHFIAADILGEKSAGLQALRGKLSVVNAAHVLHVFSIEEQHDVLKSFISLLKSEAGVMVTGRVTGYLRPGYHELSNAKSTTKGGQGKIWEHDVESFGKLWKEVGEKTGTNWDVKTWFWRFGNHTGGDDKPADWHRRKEHGIVSFVVTRL